MDRTAATPGSAPPCQDEPGRDQDERAQYGPVLHDNALSTSRIIIKPIIDPKIGKALT